MLVDGWSGEIGDTFSSLVKTGSREPAITGAKRKEGAFRIHEKHSSEPRDTGIYRTPIRRVDSSIRQKANGLARLCNKGKIPKGSPRTGRSGKRIDGSSGRTAQCIKRVCEKAPEWELATKEHDAGREGRRVKGSEMVVG